MSVMVGGSSVLYLCETAAREAVIPPLVPTQPEEEGTDEEGEARPASLRHSLETLRVSPSKKHVYAILCEVFCLFVCFYSSTVPLYRFSGKLFFEELYFFFLGQRKALMLPVRGS